MIENAIMHWILSVGLPVLSAFVVFVSKSKEQERRMAVLETEYTHISKSLNDISKRLIDVEKNHIILGEINTKLEFISEQNKEMKEDIKALQSDHLPR